MIAQVFFLGPEKIFFSATAFLKNHVRKQLGSQPHNPQTKRTPAATNKLRLANRFKQKKIVVDNYCIETIIIEKYYIETIIVDNYCKGTIIVDKYCMATIIVKGQLLYRDNYCIGTIIV